MGTDEFGLRIFKNLFNLSPRSIMLFSFQDERKLYKSEALKDHYRKVVDAIGNAIMGLKDIENLSIYLKSLGSAHKKLGVEKQHYEIIGKSIMGSLDSVLKD